MRVAYVYTYNVTRWKGSMVTAKTSKKVKVTLTLEDRGWEEMRIQAIREKRSASDIIDRLIAAYLKRKGAK
jgi:hypothetical protein